MLATGIIGGMAEWPPAGMAGVPAKGIAVPAVDIEGAAPVHADGTDNGPIEVARPSPAEIAGAPAPLTVEPSAPVLDASPTACAAPNSLAAVVAALAAVAVLPAVNNLDSMLIGIDASLSGVLSSFSIDIADVEDVVSNRSSSRRQVQALRRCEALQGLRHSRNHLRPRRHERLDVGTAGRPGGLGCGATGPPGRSELVVCGGVVNGVTCDAVAEAPA